MAGVLDEEQRDPLDFLADFPTPLTTSQRSDLAWHRAKLEGNRTSMKKIIATFVGRRQQTEKFVLAAEAKLEALLNGTAPATTATAPESSSSTMATVADNSQPTLGAKRGREEDPSAANPREADEVSATAAAAPPPPPTAAASAVVTSPPPAAATAAPAPARRKFGGAFGGLKGLLADVKKNTTNDADALAVRKQREAMAKAAEEERIREDIRIGRSELEDIDNRLSILNEKIDNISNQYTTLTNVLAVMDERETAYACAFFLTTKGCTEEAGYEICFRPAHMSDAIRDAIASQVDAALDEYLAFRDVADPFLLEIADARARRAMLQQQQEAQQQNQADRERHTNGSSANNNNAVDGGVDGDSLVVSSNNGAVGGDGILGFLPSSGAVGVLGGQPSTDDELLRMVMMGGSGVGGGASGALGSLDAVLNSVLDLESVPPPTIVGGDEGCDDGQYPQQRDGVGPHEEEDLDRYDY